MKNLTKRIMIGTAIVASLAGCERETEVIIEKYQGYHKEGSENVYVFDSEAREGRQTRTTNYRGQTMVTERDPQYRVLGDAKWKDSLEIGKKYGVRIKKNSLFADRIISVKPVEDLK